MATLYENIISLCESRGIKGGKLCVDLGISKSTLTSLKTGRTQNISMENAKKIAAYFNVPVEDLYKSDASQPYKLMENIDLQLFGEQKKEPIVKNDELSDSKRKFIDRVMQMSDEELDRLDQILRLVEGTK